MFFIAQRTTATLDLATPVNFCCNCGATGRVDLVVTPLQKTRYFFVFGTELTVNALFAYCERCKDTAVRVRQGWGSKVLTTCMVMSAVFLALVVFAESLPRFVTEHFFWSSAAIGAGSTTAYFYVQEWSRKARTYYQPVSLVDANVHPGFLGACRLKFYNPEYAALVERANQSLVENGLLEIEVRG